MNSEDLYCVKVFEKTGDSALMEIMVPETSPYFDGHFPEFSLLPAVAQVELVMRTASGYLETGMDILEMRRIKFSRVIRPNKPLMLRLARKDDTVSFKIFSREDEDIYSTGTIVISLPGESSV